MKEKTIKENSNGLISVRKTRAIKVLYWTLQGLTFSTLLFTVIMYFIRGEGLETTSAQVFMCLLALLTFNIPIFLERKFKVYIPPYITVILYVLMFSHAILGEIYRAYDNIAMFDKILHTTSGVVIALVSFSIVSILNNVPSRKTKLSPFFVVLFAFCFTMTSEYIWEVFEYVADSLVGSNMQRWQDSLVGAIPPGVNAGGEFIHNTARGNGLNDTMADMMVNIFGALGVCIYGYIGMKLKPNWFNGIVIMKFEDVVSHNVEVMKEKNLIDVSMNEEDLQNIEQTQRMAEGIAMDIGVIDDIKQAKEGAIQDVEQAKLNKIEAKAKKELEYKENSGKNR